MAKMISMQDPVSSEELRNIFLLKLEKSRKRRVFTTIAQVQMFLEKPYQIVDDTTEKLVGKQLSGVTYKEVAFLILDVIDPKAGITIRTSKKEGGGSSWELICEPPRG